jgi:hypothetical protein
MESLLDLEDLKGVENEKQRQDLVERIDELLDCELILPEENEMEPSDYLAARIDPYAITVFGGYVARQVRKMKPASDCAICKEVLCKAADESFEERESLSRIRTHGGLLRPSQALHDMLTKVRALTSNF